MIGRRLWSNQSKKGEELSPLLFTFDNVGGHITVPTNVVPDLVFSFDLGEWTDVVKGTAITVPDKTIYFKIKRGKAGGLYSSSTYSNKWIIYGAVKASGNIMSLLGQSIIGLEPYAFSSMFSGCTSLTTAPELPATVLADRCYSSMFSSCTSLTTTPELPATVLADSCYSGMFNGCTSLTTAPELPATVLADRCYSSMFSSCTSLTTTPELPATVLATGCYSSMFYGCTSLTTAPELPATALADRCYYSMFRGCTSLTTAPELPATALASYCYSSMFYGCRKINYIQCLAKENVGLLSSTNSWVRNVSESGTFVQKTGVTWRTGINGIPRGWTIVKN